MTNASLINGIDGYCGTSYAAKLLGVSVGTVQGLVESHELKAWKTQGGHRRISLQSIKEYQYRHELTPTAIYPGEDRLRMIVVEDDESSRQMYQAHFDSWAIPMDVTMYSSAMAALLDMPTIQPQVLLVDLMMPTMDGFQFLSTLRNHKSFNNLAIIVATGLSPEEVAEKGGLPKEVQMFRKPIDMERLRGFIDALMAVRLIQRRPK
jgi:excisionase family DNA binding protein